MCSGWCWSSAAWRRSSRPGQPSGAFSGRNRGKSASSTTANGPHPSIAPYETFSTADRPIALAVGNDRQFAALAEVIGDPGLAVDGRFRTNADRVAHQTALRDILTERLGTAGADHWSAVLLAAGVPAGPVNTLDEAFAFAQRLGLPSIVDIPATAADGADARPSRQVASPIALSATPVQYRLPPPSLGQHTTEILHRFSDHA